MLLAPLESAPPDISASDVPPPVAAQHRAAASEQGAPAACSARPRLRGWSHALAAAASLAFTVLIVRHGWHSPARMAPLLVYGVSMIEMYAASALFHLGTWRATWHQRLRMVDHGSIFVAIAGTATPLYAVAPAFGERVVLLTFIWMLAAAGIVLKVARPHLARGLNVALYLGMGVAAFLALLVLGGSVPLPALGWLTLGGAFYSAGALVYHRRWLDLFPHVWGFHEVFHLCVIAGNLACVVAIGHWIIPVW